MNDMGLFSHKRTVAQPINDPIFQIIKGWTDSTGEMPLDSGYKNSAIFSAVRLIAGDLSSNRIKCDMDKLEKLLNDKPNDVNNGYDLKRSLFTNLLLYGNSYALIERSPLNHSVTGFRFIPYGLIIIGYNTDTQIPSYYWADTSDNKGRQIKNEDILHFKLSPIDGVKGVSPLEALKQQRNAMKQSDDMRTNYFNTNYGKYQIRLNAGAVDPKAKENIRNEFEATNGGDNSGRPIVTDQTMDVNQFTTTADTGIVKLISDVQGASKKDIATVYGIPVDWLGIESEHNNADQSKTYYIEHALSSYMDAITSELNFKLGQHFEYDLSRLLNTNVQAQSSMAIEQYDAGIITANEARKMMNLPPLDGGDVRKENHENN